MGKPRQLRKRKAEDEQAEAEGEAVADEELRHAYVLLI